MYPPQLGWAISAFTATMFILCRYNSDVSSKRCLTHTRHAEIIAKQCKLCGTQLFITHINKSYAGSLPGSPFWRESGYERLSKHDRIVPRYSVYETHDTFCGALIVACCVCLFLLTVRHSLRPVLICMKSELRCTSVASVVYLFIGVEKKTCPSV